MLWILFQLLFFLSSLNLFLQASVLSFKVPFFCFAFFFGSFLPDIVGNIKVFLEKLFANDNVKTTALCACSVYAFSQKKKVNQSLACVLHFSLSFLLFRLLLLTLLFLVLILLPLALLQLLWCCHRLFQGSLRFGFLWFLLLVFFLRWVFGSFLFRIWVLLAASSVSFTLQALFCILLWTSVLFLSRNSTFFLSFGCHDCAAATRV